MAHSPERRLFQQMSRTFFSFAEAVARYHAYRPQVHSLIADWLVAAGLPGPYKRAVDVACGTGHSTFPLRLLAGQVDAIDASPEMVAIARSSGLDARVGTYQSLPPRAYDLISVCMAFHWFDRDEAVRSFLSASAPGAVWLIYSFWLEGHETDGRFTDWLKSWFRARFPAPWRGTPIFRPTSQDGPVDLIAEKAGTVRVAMDRGSLIGYLTTQSNVEDHIGPEYSYAEACRDIDASMPPIASEGDFQYAFRFTICRTRA